MYFMDMGFSCRKNAFFQASIKLAHPFPVRTKNLRTRGFLWKVVTPCKQFLPRTSPTSVGAKLDGFVPVGACRRGRGGTSFLIFACACVCVCVFVCFPLGCLVQGGELGWLWSLLMVNLHRGAGSCNWCVVLPLNLRTIAPVNPGELFYSRTAKLPMTGCFRGAGGQEAQSLSVLWHCVVSWIPGKTLRNCRAGQAALWRINPDCLQSENLVIFQELAI